MPRVIQLFLPLVVGLVSPAYLAGAPLSIQYDVNPLGGANYRYTYSLSGDIPLTNQAFELQFSPALYATLSGATVASADWDGLVFQPNNPIGADGVWSVLALLDSPAAVSPFTIDVVWIGIGMPGAQPFVVTQYDALGTVLSEVSSGVTARAGGGTLVPEPGTSVYLGIGAILIVIRRRRQRNAQ